MGSEDIHDDEKPRNVELPDTDPFMQQQDVPEEHADTYAQINTAGDRSIINVRLTEKRLDMECPESIHIGTPVRLRSRYQPLFLEHLDMQGRAQGIITGIAVPGEGVDTKATLLVKFKLVGADCEPEKSIWVRPEHLRYLGDE